MTATKLLTEIRISEATAAEANELAERLEKFNFDAENNQISKAIAELNSIYRTESKQAREMRKQLIAIQ